MEGKGDSSAIDRFFGGEREESLRKSARYLRVA